jgi:phage regulator Rha-like protein
MLSLWNNFIENLMADVVVLNSDVESKIITLRNQQVILDSEVAELYGVETRDINKSVKNNPDKFPVGYIFELSESEFENLRWNFSTANDADENLQSKISTTKMAKTRVLPKAFTEKGLYMLATILKSKRATETTIEIVEAFAKMRELSRTMAQLTKPADKEQQNSLMKRGGELISDILGNEMQTESSELSFELNLAFLKVKGAVKQKRIE